MPAQITLIGLWVYRKGGRHGRKVKVDMAEKYKVDMAEK
jgi:hypothetical protein